MNDLDARAFASLFRDAYRRCFSTELSTPLTESESTHMSVEIEESTGLEIGWKSLKNYSLHVLGRSVGRPENPSTPTLDMLARYVAGAPATGQKQSGPRERHYPYWFGYRERFQPSHQPPPVSAPDEEVDVGRPPVSVAKVAVAVGIALVAVLLLLTLAVPTRGTSAVFLDHFDDITEPALAARGWRLAAVDSAAWAARVAEAGHLTLFTLRGDNWPHAATPPTIRNLLLREPPSACFVADVWLTGFIPKQNWQQAGLLLLEDTSFAGKSLRLSIGFNDFAGGFSSTEEILVQAITSLGRASPNPEEIAHHRLFVVEPGAEDLIAENLAHAGLRIEKQGDRMRLLYSTGPMKNAAFREVIGTQFPMHAAYVGVFALKGFVEEASDMPVRVDAFSVTGYPCER